MASQPFNTEDYLTTPEEIAEYLDAALEDGNERLLLSALQTVAKASGGMTTLAKRSQLNRESLYRRLAGQSLALKPTAHKSQKFY